MNKSNPPRWSLRLLKFFVKKNYLEEIEGDMEEVHEDNLEQYSIKKARKLYNREVIKLLRPILIRKMSGNKQLNTIGMLQHNILIALRNFSRHKSSFMINLTGLSTGLACALLIYLWVNDEMKIDRFHENTDQLHQVLMNFETNNGINTVSWTPAPMAKVLKDEIPEILGSTHVFTYENNGIISTNEEKSFRANELYVSKDFFKVLSFKLKHGTAEQVLNDISSVVLSENLALKLFDKTDGLIGQTVKLKREDIESEFIISGVFETPPLNSTLQFDAVFHSQKLLNASPNYNKWESNDPDTYLLVQKGADLSQVNKRITEIVKSKPNVSVASTLLRPFADKYLYDNYKNGVQSGGRIIYVKLFSGIALLVLIIACINFMNLSTAQATKRVKEVGIKKAIGINRRALTFQFLGESTLLSFFGLIMALLLVWLALPEFNSITGKTLHLEFNNELLIGIFSLTFVTGLISGSYPALYLSGFNPVELLKGKLKTKASELFIRQGLVIFQFSLSTILMISIFVVFKQIDFIQSKNLGYNRDNVVTFKNEGNSRKNTSDFLQNIRTIPGVVEATGTNHDIMENDTNTTGIDWDKKDPEARIGFKYISANYHLIETLNIPLKAGRAYAKNFGNESQKVILNEAAIKVMGYENPIGKSMTIWGQNVEIIGVLEDFHFESLYKEVKPLFYRVSEDNETIMVRIEAGNEIETINRLKSHYSAYNDGLPLEFKFLDDRYQEVYESESKVAALSKYFAIVAMIISCLGLFGLATFSAQRRMKEISIRKILGSSQIKIVYMLTDQFTKIVGIALLIALPVSYWLSTSWLDGFTYHVQLEWWFFVGSILATLTVAWLTVGLQTWKTSKINPVHQLRNE